MNLPELKTFYLDVENRVLKINGEDVSDQVFFFDMWFEKKFGVIDLYFNQEQHYQADLFKQCLRGGEKDAEVDKDLH